MRAIGRGDFIPFDWDAVEGGRHRHLPQLSLTGAIYFVTFRLEDSLPQKLLKRWLYNRQAWLAEHPEPWDEITRKEHQSLFTARMERWLDAGYGECVLRDERCQKEVAERLLFRHGQDYDLGDWVVMPNHVHVLLQPLGNVSLEEIMRPIKGVSARNINRMLERSGAMWMQESFSHIVRSLEQLKKFQRYIQMNPEKAGLPATDFSYEQRWEIVRSTLGIASLRSPFGQPAAGYLRCALVPARRSAFSTAPAFPNNQTVGSRRACELCRSSMPLL